MALPVVAIIGRPNVGKSSLLNALAGEMISIVEPTAGVTRDRVSTYIEKDGKYIELVDTGGWGIVDSDALEEQIEGQILRAIESANLIIFLVDVREGITGLDETIARLLRKHNVKVIGVANKADSLKMFAGAQEFSKLGFGEFLCVSATNNLNKRTLIDKVFELLTDVEGKKPAAAAMKIAIVGKRNAGKSTLVNAMVGEERMIVSEIPGTTRDAVDVRFERDGKTIVVIDTAGVRKKRKIAGSIEFYSQVRAQRAITRADVVLFLIDATEPVGQVDKALASMILAEYKSCIIVINKWDLAKAAHASTDDFEKYLTETLVGLRDAAIAFITAKEKKNVGSLLDLAATIYRQATTWVATAKLNKAFEAMKEERPGAARGKGVKKPKIYYATQVAVNPLTILMFVNDPRLFDENYMRYLENRLKTLLGSLEVPIKLLVRKHRD